MNYKQRNKPNSSSYSKNCHQGYFRNLRNPDRYIGDKNQIIYRSSLEFKACMIFDSSKKVIRWSSEHRHILFLLDILIQYRKK